MGAPYPNPSDISEYPPPGEVARHNDEVRAVWEACRSDRPTRVPCSGGIGLRQHQAWFGYSLKEVFFDPEAAWKRQLEVQKFNRCIATGDGEIGLPEKWAPVVVHWMNIAEPEWLGCPVHFEEYAAPWADFGPLRKRKEILYEMEIPGVFSTPLGRRTLEYMDCFRDKAAREEFDGRPVAPPTYAGFYTQGPFELACHLRGSTELCTDIYEDPTYFHDLMDFCTRAIIVRIKAIFGGLLSVPMPFEHFAYSDDSIAMLSPEAFQEHVWPYHRRMFDELATPTRTHFLHLCGSVQQHIPFLANTGLINYVGTSYPIDIPRARREAGDDLWLDTAIHADIVLRGSAETIDAAVAAKLTPEAKGKGRLVFMGGNYIAPGTTLDKFLMLYESVKRHGVYR